jgi:hypothetical protein
MDSCARQTGPSTTILVEKMQSAQSNAPAQPLALFINAKIATIIQGRFFRISSLRRLPIRPEDGYAPYWFP